ncbi:MAG TPA: hypothetical protein PKH06_00500 [Candidatus Dojkabacteria bacterium]|nr:hypothetical protein [Candidatus Dojkabacteria bacterium]
MEDSDLVSETINLVPSKRGREENSKRKYKVTEILLILSAVGIVAFLALLAINPSKEASEARNLKRTADISTILTYISTYVDEKENIPEVIPQGKECVTFTHEICKTGPYNCKDMVNMGFLSEENTDALVIMPNDPLYISTNGTGYYVCTDGNGYITVCAPYAERNEKISFSKYMY